LLVGVALLFAERSGSAGSPIRILGPEWVKAEAANLLDRYPDLEILTYDSPEEMAERVVDCDALIGRATADAVAAGTKLRWIQVTSAGVERYLRISELQTSETIVLTNFRIYQGPEIADHAMALLLALTRNLPAFIANMESRTWDRTPLLPMIELRGKTMLIIGLGGIGTQLAERAHASGMKVIATNASDVPLMGAVDYVGREDEFLDLLPEADVVVSCVPWTSATEGMFDAEAFAAMKEGVYFVNISRGAVVGTDALIAALESGKVLAAGLDVVMPEPLPADSPLWSMPNVIITPHVAGRSDMVDSRRRKLVLENISRFMSDRPLKNVVGKSRGY
jgi:phosphoglycerate dehydrogenase-like enzyme